MTAETPWPQVLCGFRETRTTGTWECVCPAGCDGRHYLVRLVHTAPGPVDRTETTDS